MITEEDLEQFKELYKEHFGITLSNAEAQHDAQKLINLGLAIRAYMRSRSAGGHRDL